MPNKIEWSDELLVNVADIDSDHQKLFALMNDIFATAHHGAAAINSAIGALCSYTKEHFASEQESMRRADYPALSAHTYEHEHLVFQLESMINRLMEAGPDAVDEALATFLEEWLTSHILKFDMEYAAYLRKSGQKG
jgi:hemerythrin